MRLVVHYEVHGNCLAFEIVLADAKKTSHD